MSEEECLCARCAGMGKTCCQTAQVFVTKRDIDRIAAVVRRHDFYEIAPPADAEYLPDPEVDPVWARIFHGGERRVLRHDGKGDCQFLGEKGCRLAMEVRPYVCRLYPFEYTDQCLKGVYGHLCPQPERDNAPLLLALLGMNRDEAEKWRRALYEAILEEYPG